MVRFVEDGGREGADGAGIRGVELADSATGSDPGGETRTRHKIQVLGRHESAHAGIADYAGTSAGIGKRALQVGGQLRIFKGITRSAAAVESDETDLEGWA